MIVLGSPVTYFDGERRHAGLVTQVREGGAIDLVFFPAEGDQAPRYVQNVAAGTESGTFAELAPAAAEPG